MSKTVKKTKKNRNLLGPGPGRPKGSMNRFTTLKESFLEAFHETGGTDGLVRWIKANPRNRGAFYSLVARMLPADVNIVERTEKPRIIVIGEYGDDGPRVLSGQAELDALGANAPADLKPLQGSGS